MKRIIALFALALALPFYAAAESKTIYSVTKDEFGRGETHRVLIATTETSMAALILSCYSGENLQAQLNTQETIFPNHSRDGFMWLQVTYKVDTADEPVTQLWRMPMMKYSDAWLLEGVRPMIDQILAGQRLSLRLDKRGTIYRFDLKEAASDLPKVLDACAV